MRLWLCLALLLAGLASAPGAQSATSPDEMLSDPAQEQRARALGRELRCLVCQNQSIDDSDADLARDLRRLVRERIEAGDSDREIIAYLAARYGDFILLRPPVTPATLALWLAPAIILAIAGGALAIYLRRRRDESGAPAPLGPEERARVEVLTRRGEPRAP